jgi:hypothetical protein
MFSVLHGDVSLLGKISPGDQGGKDELDSDFRQHDPVQEFTENTIARQDAKFQTFDKKYLSTKDDLRANF